MTSSSTLRDLEDLAAYLDGRLQGARLAAVEQRLAQDEAFYEIFEESLRFRQENEAPSSHASASARVAPIGRPGRSDGDEASVAHPRRQLGRWLPAIVAAVLVLAAVGTWRASQPSSRALPADFDYQTALANDQWTYREWSVNRSADLPLHLSTQEVAFRLGVGLEVLAAGLRAGERDEARLGAARVESYVQRLDPLAALLYAGLHSGLAADLPLETALRRAEEARDHLLDGASIVPLRRQIENGAWSERARLAALAADGETLLNHLRRPPEALSTTPQVDAVTARLTALTPRIADGHTTAFVEALEHLAELQGQLGGSSEFSQP